jgi:hypothetical protein
LTSADPLYAEVAEGERDLIFALETPSGQHECVATSRARQSHRLSVGR